MSKLDEFIELIKSFDASIEVCKITSPFKGTNYIFTKEKIKDEIVPGQYGFLRIFVSNNKLVDITNDVYDEDLNLIENFSVGTGPLSGREFNLDVDSDFLELLKIAEQFYNGEDKGWILDGLDSIRKA